MYRRRRGRRLDKVIQPEQAASHDAGGHFGYLDFTASQPPGARELCRSQMEHRVSAGLWEQVVACFDTNDGSLPGIFVSNLSAASVAGIYAMLRRRSKLAGDSPPEFWSIRQQKSVAVDSVPNAAALVAAGQGEPFHFCIEGLVAYGRELPVLGVFVWHDAIELDYRMGPEWGPQEIAGFFELLRDCCDMDSGAVVLPADCEGPPYPQLFLQAWAAYNAGGSASRSRYNANKAASADAGGPSRHS